MECITRRDFGAGLALAAVTFLAGCASAPARESEEKPLVLSGISADDLDAAVDQIRAITDFEPRIGIVLGTGLGSLAEQVETVATIRYGELDGFPISTVGSHKGQYVFGNLHGVPVVLMEGRVHYYEGYPMEQVVLPVCTMARLGAETIILTNAAGSLNPEILPGTLMCIDDHISSFVPSPLVGKNDEALGPRFTDMSQVYDPDLIALAHTVADEQGTTLVDGVYLQVTGPCFETPAESQLYEDLGADAVGMSTACEAVALHHMGARILGFSCITNIATLDHTIVTDHNSVVDVADKAASALIELIAELVARI